jgi:hypothetical protein
MSRAGHVAPSCARGQVRNERRCTSATSNRRNGTSGSVHVVVQSIRRDDFSPAVDRSRASPSSAVKSGAVRT